MNIEEIAQNSPHLPTKSLSILYWKEDCLIKGVELAFKLGLIACKNKQFTDIFMGLSRLFLEKDSSLLEVNPLVLTKQGI